VLAILKELDLDYALNEEKPHAALLFMSTMLRG